MAKAHFNRNTGKFEMRFRDGRRASWEGSKWVSDNGRSFYSSSFMHWYNRKGRFIQRNWKNRTSKTTAPKLILETRSTVKSNKYWQILITFFIIVIIFIVGFSFYAAYKNNNTSNNNYGSLYPTTVQALGTQSNPFQPNPNDTLAWQGSGYYYIPQTISASGLQKGVDQLSAQSQVDSYNQWASQLKNSQPVVNTTTTLSSTSTVIQSTLSTAYTTTISQISPTNMWATQFFENVSTERGASYNYCPALSQFAEVRFNTQVSNYEISHYGVSQDNQQYGIYDAEEILFQSGSPAEYASQLSVDDPLHWQLLTDTSYTYYGYYIGNGPDVESFCNPPPEIPGPNINVSQYLESKGCTPITETATYFIVELDNVCPSQLA
ncbi:MAG TPA: hypothetical protein VND15_03445 [Candidatus Acidoferrales bacterium]|nr:hypothetical protein [Candidatus Acidoferrales bacterium]